VKRSGRRMFIVGRIFSGDRNSLAAMSEPLEDKREAGCCVMIIEVMKVAQQPAMAYDRDPLSTAVRLGKSGLLLNSL
jgi:hypothetical protein